MVSKNNKNFGLKNIKKFILINESKELSEKISKYIIDNNIDMKYKNKLTKLFEKVNNKLTENVNNNKKSSKDSKKIIKNNRNNIIKDFENNDYNKYDIIKMKNNRFMLLKKYEDDRNIKVKNGSKIIFDELKFEKIDYNDLNKYKYKKTVFRNIEQLNKINNERKLLNLNLFNINEYDENNLNFYINHYFRFKIIINKSRTELNKERSKQLLFDRNLYETNKNDVKNIYKQINESGLFTYNEYGINSYNENRLNKILSKYFNKKRIDYLKKNLDNLNDIKMFVKMINEEYAKKALIYNYLLKNSKFKIKKILNEELDILIDKLIKVYNFKIKLYNKKFNKNDNKVKLNEYEIIVKSRSTKLYDIIYDINNITNELLYEDPIDWFYSNHIKIMNEIYNLLNNMLINSSTKSIKYAIDIYVKCEVTDEDNKSKSYDTIFTTIFGGYINDMEDPSKHHLINEFRKLTDINNFNKTEVAKLIIFKYNDLDIYGYKKIKFESIKIKMAQYNQILGESYLEYPSNFTHDRSCINIKNDDNKCFLYAILSILKYDKVSLSPKYSKCRNHVNSIINYVNEIDDSMLEYPVNFNNKDMINTFEIKNNININILYWNNDDKKCEPYYSSKYSNYLNNRKVIFLLLISNKDFSKFHYIGIKNDNISNIIHGNKTNKRDHKTFCCLNCYKYYSNENEYNNHIKINCKNNENDNLRIFPKEGEKMYFNKYIKCKDTPIELFCDFETSIKPYYSCNKTDIKSRNTNIHEANSYKIYVKSDCDDFNSKMITGYSNDYNDLKKQFVNDLMNIEYEVQNFYKENKYKYLININKNQEIIHNNKKICDLCKFEFNDVRIKCLDHDHFKKYNNYRYTLCNSCNCAINNKKINIPVFFHNGTNYDNHIFINELANYLKESNIKYKLFCEENNKKYKAKELTVIPLTKEKYMYIEVKSLKILDTFKHLSSSLDGLSNSLLQKDKDGNILHNDYNKNKFIDTFNYFMIKGFNEDDIYLLLKKSEYPYEWFDDVNKFNYTELLNKDDFNTKLKDNISDNQYEHYKLVYTKFCKCFKDYHDIYLAIDVLSLCAVWNDFKILCKDMYGLNPSNYITAASLAWDAFLKKSKINLELISDSKMYDLIKKNIFGGISQVSKRHAIANNKYMKNYNKNIISSYLIYLDYNSLYPSAMIKNMPYKDLKFIECDNLMDYFNKYIINSKDIYNDINDSKGWFIEMDISIDLNYKPINGQTVYDYLSQYPLFPDHEKINIDNLSEYQKDLKNNVYKNIKMVSTEKLILDLNDKKNILWHYQYVKFALKHGYKIDKIHSIIEFTQSKYWKEYIDDNIVKRIDYKIKGDTAMSNNIKLFNNSPYGKSYEDVEKRKNIKIVYDEDTFIKESSNPFFNNFYHLDDYNNDFRLVEFNKKKVKYNKPIYIGKSILDISKLLMTEFYYKLKDFYGDNMELCFTDTDSLCLYIKTEDLYKDLSINFEDYLDLGVYEKTCIEKYFTKDKIKSSSGILDRLKDECNDKNNGELYVMTEFIGIRSKVYYYDKENTVNRKIKNDSRAKGISKYVKSKYINKDDYLNCILNNKVKNVEINNFKSNNHKIYTQNSIKTALHSFDDKTYLINNIDSVSHGYNELKEKYDCNINNK